MECEDINFQALIDTGAEISIISKDKILENKNKFFSKILKTNKIKLTTANGKRIDELNEVLNIEFKINDYVGNHSFILMPCMRVDCILGADFLNQTGAIINFDDKYLQIENEKINFLKKEGEENEIKIVNRINCEEYKPCTQEVVEINENNHQSLLAKLEKIVCPSVYKPIVQKLLRNCEELFNQKTRVTNVYEHHLDVDKNAPFNSKTYPIPYKLRGQVKDEINKMLEEQIIEKSSTNYINPIVIAKKKDNKIRICLDARKINEITKPIYDKPVNIETIIGRLKSDYIYTKLDLKNSFWLIPLAKESRKYTGFSIEGNIYHFKVCPFGLQSSSAALIRALQKILNLYDEFCIHYIDDILLFSPDRQTHERHLGTILMTLDNAGLKLNIEKCQFFQESVEYLGYIINREGISVNQERLKEITNYPRPTNLRTLRGFLGILNYYKRFIPNLSEKEIPLIALLKKGVRWKWDPGKETAFNNLKEEFSKNLMIYNPDYTKTFILRTDASAYAIAAELLQIQNGIEVPICFVSRVLKSYEIKYTVSEKEMLAVCFSVSRLRFYLTLNEFVIETDHIALKYLMSHRFANSRIYRWSLLLQEYTFKIEHRKGRDNITADALSRKDQHLLTKPVGSYLVAMNLLIHQTGIYSLEEVKNSQITLLKSKEKLTSRDMKAYQLHNEIIIKNIQEKELYVISVDLAIKIVYDLHLRFGHLGIRKTWMIFRENYYARNDIGIIKNVIAKCELCCLGKYKNHVNQNSIESIQVSKPLELISIDFISNLTPTKDDEYRHLLVIYDVYSKFVKLYPTQKCNTNTVIKKINEFYQEIGKPIKLLTDNATYFSNDRFKQFCLENNIKLIFTSIRRPCANPVERYNQEVIKLLRLYTYTNHTLWDQYLNEIEFYINNTPSTTTKMCPILLMKNMVPSRPWEVERLTDIKKLHDQVKETVKKQSEKYKLALNKKIKNRVKFNLKDLVIVKCLRVPDSDRDICAKLQLPYEGPYEICNVVNENVYEIRNIKSKLVRGKFHINLLYPYINKK